MLYKKCTRKDFYIKIDKDFSKTSWGMSKLNQQLQPQNNTAKIIWEDFKMAKHFKVLSTS